jgi:hypothetical protein
MPRRRPKKQEHRPFSNANEHFDRTGRPKKNYRTETEAKQSAQASWAINRVDLDAYRCSICHQWHIGKRFREP